MESPSQSVKIVKNNSNKKATCGQTEVDMAEAQDDWWTLHVTKNDKTVVLKERLSTENMNKFVKFWTLRVGKHRVLVLYRQYLLGNI